LLVKVRDYRKKYGRGEHVNPNIDPAEVDRKINQAIAYLETIHNTNDWFPFKAKAMRSSETSENKLRGPGDNPPVERTGTSRSCQSEFAAQWHLVPAAHRQR
jgi:hypothetical protein